MVGIPSYVPSRRACLPFSEAYGLIKTLTSTERIRSSVKSGGQDGARKKNLTGIIGRRV